jgi:hypothetical protein
MKRLFAALFLGLVGALVVASGVVASGEILRAVMQILGGGVIGFFAGLLVERKQIQYQRRATVVEELRQRLREARESLADMFTPPEYPLDAYWPEEVVEVGEKQEEQEHQEADAQDVTPTMDPTQRRAARKRIRTRKYRVSSVLASEVAYPGVKTQRAELDASSDYFEANGYGLATKTRKLLEESYRLDPYWPEEVVEVGEKLDALSDYFEAKGNWLDTKTRELLEELYRLDPYWPEEVAEVGEKLDALSDYFEAKGNWLDTKTRKLLEEFTDEMALLWADLQGCLDSGENLYPPLKAAWAWLNAADEAVEEINERFDRLVGTHTHKFGRSTQGWLPRRG